MKGVTYILEDIMDHRERLFRCNKYDGGGDYKNAPMKVRFADWFLQYPQYQLRQYVNALRMQEYYLNTSGNNPIKKRLANLYERKKTHIGNKLGIEIGPNCFEEGLILFHNNIVINPRVRGGKNCHFHGNNCVGNDAITPEAPRLGSNVDVGFGAVIIGNITIADNVKIGANAVVTKSILEPGCTVAGVPAKIIRHGNID